jgi:hypothetical protein
MDAAPPDGKAVSPRHSRGVIPAGVLTGSTKAEQTRLESARLTESGFVPYQRWWDRPPNLRKHVRRKPLGSESDRTRRSEVFRFR